jgi:hypothetical protein
VPAHATPALVPTPEVKATVASDSAAVAPKEDSAAVVLVVEEPRKKKRKTSPKAELTIVDIPANFEIQASKVMPVASDWADHNLDTWWGRANLMVLTESDNFIGKIHLRMYPGNLYNGSNVLVEENPDKGTSTEYRDIIMLYEAWAWHRGDFMNLKIGRWDNTTRYGSQAFGGYIDARRNTGSIKDVNIRAAGFMSSFAPENAVQFGFNNFSENMSFDVALISGDNHLNTGDLRVHFSFKELAGLENMEFGIGYRSNVFDEVYSKYGDVTHTVDVGVRTPIVWDIGLLKSLGLFGEAALIGLDDQIGEGGSRCTKETRCDKGKTEDFAFAFLGGLELELYRGLDKIVIEAEYASDRKTKTKENGEKPNVKDVAGSIYLQKKLSDRFTLNLGVQNENNTKDFSFAGRLQGRIN